MNISPLQRRCKAASCAAGRQLDHTELHHLYVAPIKGNVPAMGADLKRHPLAGPVLDIALDQRRTQITPTLELMQGGRGFAAYSPVLGSDGEIIGIINGAFRIRSMLASVINTEQVEDYTVRVREGDTVLFEIRGEGDDETLQRTVSFEVVGRQWQVDVIADPKLAQTAVHPELVVIFGSLSTVLFTVIMFLLTNRQKALCDVRFITSMSGMTSMTCHCRLPGSTVI